MIVKNFRPFVLSNHFPLLSLSLGKTAWYKHSCSVCCGDGWQFQRSTMTGWPQLCGFMLLSVVSLCSSSVAPLPPCTRLRCPPSPCSGFMLLSVVSLCSSSVAPLPPCTRLRCPPSPWGGPCPGSQAAFGGRGGREHTESLWWRRDPTPPPRPGTDTKNTQRACDDARTPHHHQGLAQTQRTHREHVMTPGPHTTTKAWHRHKEHTSACDDTGTPHHHQAWHRHKEHTSACDDARTTRHHQGLAQTQRTHREPVMTQGPHTTTKAWHRHKEHTESMWWHQDPTPPPRPGTDTKNIYRNATLARSVWDRCRNTP